jgi:hypothetical protein
LAGPTNLSLKFNAHLRLGNSTRALAAAGFTENIDLRGAYAAAASPPRALLLYSAQNWDDRIHAQNMLGLPSVTFEEIPDSREHNLARALIEMGRFRDTLRWLVEGG